MRKKVWNPAKWDGSGKRHEDVHGWNTEKMWIPQVSWIQPAGFQEGLIVELAVGKAHLQSAMWTGEQWPTNLLVDLDYAVWVINCPVLGSTVSIYIYIYNNTFLNEDDQWKNPYPFANGVHASFLKSSWGYCNCWGSLDWARWVPAAMELERSSVSKVLLVMMVKLKSAHLLITLWLTGLAIIIRDIYAKPICKEDFL